MTRVSAILFLLAFCAVTIAAEETTPVSPADAKVAQDAELRLLRSSIERQQREIAALKSRVAELTAQLEELGIAAAGSTPLPATRPAARPRRIVFVLDTYNVWAGRKISPADEVARAVGELSPDQWFNIVWRPYPYGDPLALQKNMLPAVDKSKEQLQRFLKSSQSPSPDALPAMALALGWKPDLIWYVGGSPPDPAKFLAEVQKLNATRKVKINTTVQFVPDNSPLRRFLWQLAHDSGGICLDEKGQPLPEPPISVRVELPKPPPPATQPSILRVP